MLLCLKQNFGVRYSIVHFPQDQRNRMNPVYTETLIIKSTWACKNCFYGQQKSRLKVQNVNGEKCHTTLYTGTEINRGPVAHGL
jgi:hypothetical protein